MIPESLPKQYRVNIERSSTLPYLFNQLSNHSKGGGIYLLTQCIILLAADGVGLAGSPKMLVAFWGALECCWIKLFVLLIQVPFAAAGSSYLPCSRTIGFAVRFERPGPPKIFDFWGERRH